MRIFNRFVSREVWCIVEHRAGRFDPDSLQLVAAARKLEGTAVAVVCAADADELVGMVARHADRVIVLQDPALEHFTPDGYAQAIVPLAKERQPAAVLTLHSHFLGRDFYLNVHTSPQKDHSVFQRYLIVLKPSYYRSFHVQSIHSASQDD